MSVCEKNYVGLWEKSCRFVGKIVSVCGKNHVSLWEKSCRFVGKIMSVCGKNLLVRKLHRKIPENTPKKKPGIFTSICQGTASHNVYLTENSQELKTVQLQPYFLFSRPFLYIFGLWCMLVIQVIRMKTAQAIFTSCRSYRLNHI